ncbi:restriction endonuclease [Streptomyces albospinus]|uniref:restriction endonuclease n=1 Tax=Streptomyces albospinus TaxID=285515 RepID=UPI003570E0A3
MRASRKLSQDHNCSIKPRGNAFPALTFAASLIVKYERYTPSNRVGAPAIYAIDGTCRASRCDNALIVTTSSFSPDTLRPELGPHAC